MFTYTLNDGNTIPWIGFGTGTALFKKDAAGLVSQAISNGITHLDGAQMYQNEESVGEGIKNSGKPRSELFITTKLDDFDASKKVKDTLLDSLKKLGVEYVDLFLIHDPTRHSKPQGRLQDVWKEMEEIKDEGLAKSIGVSNFKVEDLEVILPTARIIPAINQIELHPYVWKAAQPIVEYCQKKNITVASYGGLTPIVRHPEGPLKSVLSRIQTRLEQEHKTPVSEGQVLTKWLLQKDVVVVTTTSKPSRIREFMETADLPELRAEETREIEESGSQLHKRVFMRHVFGE